VASSLTTLSVRDMIEALIAGERDPKVLAKLARGRMKVKYNALVDALTGRFDAHHAELARMLLDQIDVLSAQIGTLTARIEELIAAIPAAQGVDRDGTAGPGAGREPGSPVLPLLTGLMRSPASAEILRRRSSPRSAWIWGAFPPQGTWCRGPNCPRTVQSGAKNRSGPAGKGNPYLKGALGEAAAATARTDTFLGERYRRIVRHRGKLKALVAVARSILVIVWHLLTNRAARYHDLGPGYYAGRIDKDRKTRSHIRQLEALGYTVTLAPAA
jgi:transposase